MLSKKKAIFVINVVEVHHFQQQAFADKKIVRLIYKVNVLLYYLFIIIIFRSFNQRGKYIFGYLPNSWKKTLLSIIFSILVPDCILYNAITEKIVIAIKPLILHQISRQIASSVDGSAKTSFLLQP